MRILKPGEPCPCCGAPIRADLPRGKLLLLSYIAEGISLLDAVNAIAEVMELPLAGVEPSEKEQAPQTQEQPVEAGPEQKMVGLMGPRAAEKRVIMEKLKAYRRKYGLGHWPEVVKASGGKLTDDQLRDMCAGTAVLPISEWRLADKALDKLYEKEAENG